MYAITSAGSGSVPTVAVLVSLLVGLIPTTIGGLLSAIGIAGMDRVMQDNVLALSGKAVEASGDVNTRMSGVNVDRRKLRKGASSAVAGFVKELGGSLPPNFEEVSDRISREGGTPLAVADGPRALGVIYLKDIVKGGMKERMAQLRRMGIRSVMITGDNPLTAAAIANEAGVDDFLAQATPADKLAYIRKEQAEGRLVAMTGDGTNDAPGLGAGLRRCGYEYRNHGG